MRLVVAAVLTVGAFAGVAVPTGTAHACSCEELSFAEFESRFGDEIRAVFVGEQTDRTVENDQTDDGAVLTFDVSEVYLGDVPAVFEVRTPAQSSACGLDLSGRPDVALVASTFDGRPNVGLCGSLFPIAEIEAVLGAPGQPVETADDSPDAEPPDAEPPDGESNTGTIWLLVSTLAAVSVIGGAIALGSKRRSTEGPRSP